MAKAVPQTAKTTPEDTAARPDSPIADSIQAKPTLTRCICVDSADRRFDAFCASGGAIGETVALAGDWLMDMRCATDDCSRDWTTRAQACDAPSRVGQAHDI